MRYIAAYCGILRHDATRCAAPRGTATHRIRCEQTFTHYLRCMFTLSVSVLSRIVHQCDFDHHFPDLHFKWFLESDRDGHELDPSTGWVGLGWVGLDWVDFFGVCRGLGSLILWWLGQTTLCFLFWHVVCSAYVQVMHIRITISHQLVKGHTLITDVSCRHRPQTAWQSK